jgi:hypothetical protein
MTAGEPKKTIAIVVYPERGALYPTFALAKTLAGRGHRVIYFGVVDFEDDVRRQGLEHVTLFGDVFGRGTMDREPEPPARRLRDRVRRLRASAARDGRQLEALKAELVDGKATALLREHGVDLVLVETSVALFLAPSLVVAGFPTVGLSIELYSPAPVVPPTFTPILADGTPQSALRARAAWAQHWLELRATQAVVAAGSASGFFPRRLFFGSTNERSGAPRAFGGRSSSMAGAPFCPSSCSRRGCSSYPAKIARLGRARTPGTASICRACTPICPSSRAIRARSSTRRSAPTRPSTHTRRAFLPRSSRSRASDPIYASLWRSAAGAARTSSATPRRTSWRVRLCPS